MADFPIKNRQGTEIDSIDAWGVLGKPASESHWKVGRSAYELARSWTGNQGPATLERLLSEIAALQGIEFRKGIAEAQTRFDDFGGPRNHDLLLIGVQGASPIVASVEGKADEPFGETIGSYSRAARAKREAGESTNAPARLDGLLAAIAGWQPDQLAAHEGLRYQLFSGVAGALAEAKRGGAPRAVFCIHELGGEVDEVKLERNAVDLDAFLGEVFPGASRVEVDSMGFVAGPMKTPGSEHIDADTDLYIAKMSTSPAGAA